MEQQEEKPSSMGKSLLSAVALVIALLLLMYAAPMLQEKLKDWSDKKADGEQSDTSEVPDTSPSPEVPSELAGWLIQVQSQLPKNEDGSSKYRVLHMRLSSDSGQLLLDLQEITEDGSNRFDLILNRDKFGRYISDEDRIALKLYPK